ncbi:MAG TPA: IS1595 family transposase [Solirubrobacterales bacterium]|nr:IS1595 family transposase [Solirubrobacterales bacterium]
MPPANRHQPIRAKSSTSEYSVHEFLAEFPDDAACLEHLWRTRHAPDGEHAHCPKCDCRRAFKRYATKQQRQSWTCTGCGHHLHPTAGTIFHRSSTSLRLWFYAMHLMTSTRCGISAKQLERELGVHYKTAWRMFNKIRTELMCDPEPAPKLKGEVEIDETSWGGKPRKKLKPRSRELAQHRESRATILGMVERGGRVRLRVIASRRGEPLSSAVRAHLDPAAFMLTDDWVAYKPLRREFDHAVINHSTGCYVDGNVHTNTIEGFFGNLKTGMRGAYKKVSPKHLQSYLDEFAWRHNNRYHGQRSMFHALVREAARQ